MTALVDRLEQLHADASEAPWQELDADPRKGIWGGGHCLFEDSQ